MDLNPYTDIAGRRFFVCLMVLVAVFWLVAGLNKYHLLGDWQ
jgi:hypothetical protein